MGIMDLFRGATPTAANSPALNQAGQPAQPTTQVTQAPTPAVVPESTAPESPLDKFADIWKIDPTKSDDPGSIFSVDPVKLQEAASKVNFAQVIPQDAIQKMSEGGQGAVEAFITSMNSVAQASYAQSAMAATKIVEQALGKAQQSYDVKIQDMIKRNSVSESLRGENPLFSNPAVSPFLNAMEKQFTEKYPTASSAEITKLAKEYMVELSKALNPATPEPEKKPAGGDYDFSLFLK